MRIAKDQKERYDKEMAEKMENAKKAQVEKEAAEAAARAQAQAAKKAAEEAKAIAKAAAKTTAKSTRSADEKTGAMQKSKVGVPAEGATGNNQDFIVEDFEEEEENYTYEDSDIENEGQEGKGGKGAKAVREEKGEGYGGGKKLGKEDSLVPDAEIGKKFKDCDSCHYRLKQFTIYSFKIYKWKHIEIKQ